MSVLHTLDPLTLPLTGWQLIEASAGTGKTWTLAALYVRLVLGHAPRSAGTDQADDGGSALTALGPGLYPPQILVMTFTEAATAELRERIRQRLAQAAKFFQLGPSGQGDDFLHQLRCQIAPELWPLCAWRLDMSAQWMDEAAIFTIHGWCNRMLKTHAFDSASLFEQSRVQDSERLKLIAVQDYWRHWFYALDAQALAALHAVGETPQALLDQLKALWRVAERAPAAETVAPEPPDVLLARWSLWQGLRAGLEAAARPDWSADIVQSVGDAAAAKHIKGYRPDWLAGWLAQMADWAQGGDIKPETLGRFTLSTLLAKGWAQAANWPVLGQLEALHDHLNAEPDVATAVLAHAAVEVARAYQSAKAQAAQFDFSDLLQNLYYALQAPDGRLASAIAAQYPVALVDEFQDTDPWQFGSLGKIYNSSANSDAGLIMIGDPKQAIYSFRGADLATYLVAREQAHGVYTLPGNYRSSAAVVAAVNQVFGSASTPFGAVPFVPAVACNAKVQPLQVAGQAQTALTVWHLTFEKTPTKGEFLQQMAAVFASQMVALLSTGAARSGDMAVLVRDWLEAAAIRDALATRGVRSVYLSERNSVYASPEASDLWRILRAVASPSTNRLVRAALATPTWGLSWNALDTLFADESAWDALVDQFIEWQRVWRAQGFLPMLHRLLHDQGLAKRLLQDSAQGERGLTNLLHLGELLQAASMALQGEGALIRYLEDQLRRPQASGEEAQLRLESDANLVQVVTLHKSKGLEYPLVFLPFVSLYRAQDSDSERPDAERLSEDIRLLYVALTRAKQALWLGVAQVRGDLDGKSPKAKSAVSCLLGRATPNDLWERLQTWRCDDIALQTAPQPTLESYRSRLEVKPAKPARVAQRRLAQRWWSASFSALTRDLAQRQRDVVADRWGDAMALAQPPTSERDERLQDAQLDSAEEETPSNVIASQARQAMPSSVIASVARQSMAPDFLDCHVASLLAMTQVFPVMVSQERQAMLPGDVDHGAADLLSTEPPFNGFPAGSTYGTLLHDLLQWQAEHGWPAARAAAATGDADAALGMQWAALLARHGQRLNLSADHSALLAAWIARIITSNMPLAPVNKSHTAIQLGDITAADRWPEMGFTLPVQSLGSPQIDQLMTRYIWPELAREPLQRRQLQGMLTGFMDLVLLHEGRYYVLDYKSNRLDGYAPAQLRRAMLAHRYDLQAALYLLALHRLLKSRLPGYDYDLHVGGALYLFLRGVDQAGAGLLHLAPPRALIESLDAAFSQNA